jgi:Fur family ferric uptake transcriptional regulator
MPVRARMRQFEQALRERGLKSTSQRDDIARVFFAAESHLSIEELYRAVKKVNPRVGYATVYRTLKLLKEVGLAAERHFDDGQARFEAIESENQHHDHIICERCGKIVEFASHELERLQERIGRFLGFTVGRHRMELYGICAACREGRGHEPRRERGVHRV